MDVKVVGTDIYFQFTKDEIETIPFAPPPSSTFGVMEMLRRVGIKYPNDLMYKLADNKQTTTESTSEWASKGVGTSINWEPKGLIVISKDKSTVWHFTIFLKASDAASIYAKNEILMWLPAENKVFGANEIASVYPAIVPVLSELQQDWKSIGDWTYVDLKYDSRLGWFIDGTSSPGTEDV